MKEKARGWMDPLGKRRFPLAGESRGESDQHLRE